MMFFFYSFVLLSIFGLTYCDSVKPQLEHCRTSLGERGRCMPLSDCTLLRDYAEGKEKDRLVSVIEDFGCGFRKVVFVCCTDRNVLKPFEGSEHLISQEHSHVHYHGESHQNHHHQLPMFSQSDTLNDNRRPGLESETFAGFGGIERPEKKGSTGDEFVDGFKEKPVHEETGEGDYVDEGRQPKENEESKKGKATTPVWESSDFIVPQEDSWVWPSVRKSFDMYPGPTSSPSGYGGLPIGQSTTYIGSSTPGFQGSSDNQGFSGGSGSSNNFYSHGSIFSTSGFINGRPNQNVLNNQRPQVFSNSDNERPTNQGLGNTNRPVSQGFENERPFGSGFGNESPSSGLNRPSNYDRETSRPSSGLNRPSNYDRETSRPSSGRPGSQGSRRPTNYQEGDSFGSGSFLNGGSNGQRPNHQTVNNQGSNKKPNRGGSNKRRLLPDGKCGTEISDKIIGGENTKLDEFPWMALLHFSTKSGQDRGYGCGGSLINERYVLTAAHCIKGSSLPDNVIVKDVRLGEYDLTKEKDCVNEVCSPSPLDVDVEEIIVHPDYKPNDKAQHHDIALIRLRKKVPFTTYVSPICLPGDELKNKDYTGKQMVVAGWGKTANGANAKSSAVKQKVTLPFVTLEDCKPFYEGINIRLRNTQLCAGGERAKDSCQGDSGGPLMTNEISNGQSSWFATGIVSFGPEDCGIQNIAGVYTRVSEYIDWIIDNMKE